MALWIALRACLDNFLVRLKCAYLIIGLMKTAIIVHGTCDREEYFSERFPSLSNSHWFPWLQKQFLINNYQAYAPEMPMAYFPEYQSWKEELERCPIFKASILVGHSCGAGFLLRWLSETGYQIKRLVLVAPWLDPLGDDSKGFFDFKIDPLLTERIEIHLVESTNDGSNIRESVRRIRHDLPRLNYHSFKNYGHFYSSDMGTEEFPQLMDICLNSGTSY